MESSRMVCRVANNYLADALGCTTRSISNARAELENYKLIRVSDQSQHLPNLFTIMHHEWVSYFRDNPGKKPDSKILKTRTKLLKTTSKDESRGTKNDLQGDQNCPAGGPKLSEKEYLKSTLKSKTSISPLEKETGFSEVPGRKIRLGPPDGSMGDTPGEPIGDDQGEPEIDVEKILKGKVRPSKVEDINPESKRITNHDQRMEIIRTHPEYLNMIKYFPEFGVEDNVLPSRLWSKRRRKGVIRDGDREIISTGSPTTIY